MQKYYNPRLHNAVVAGTGMEHPRRPHVVLGSELNGYVQGDLVDANGICDLIHEKNVDTFAKLESLETSLRNESKARIEGMDNLSEQMDRIIAEKLGSTETVYGESVQRAAEDERLQSQINDLNSKYTALGNSLSALNTTVNGKQDTLVAGNNIKNINDGTNTVSLLGAGDIRFKTINGQSILGDEDIPVAAGGGGSTVIHINKNTKYSEIKAAIEAAPDKENVYITEYPDPEAGGLVIASDLPHFTMAKLNTEYYDGAGSSTPILFENDNTAILAILHDNNTEVIIIPKGLRYSIFTNASNGAPYGLADILYGHEMSSDEAKILHLVSNVISYNGVYYYLHAVNADYGFDTRSVSNDSNLLTTQPPTQQPIMTAQLYSIYKRVDSLDESANIESDSDLNDYPNAFYICNNGVYSDKNLSVRSRDLASFSTVEEFYDALNDTGKNEHNTAKVEFCPFRYGSIVDYYLVNTMQGERQDIYTFYSKSTNTYVVAKVVRRTGGKDPEYKVADMPATSRYTLTSSFSGQYTINTVRDVVTGARLDPYEVHLYTDTIVDFDRNTGSQNIYKLYAITPDGMTGPDWDGTSICSWYRGKDPELPNQSIEIFIGAKREESAS